MADGVTFQSATPATPAAGTIAATDDAGAAGQVQIIKLAISTDGSATVIPADAANGLDVDVTRLPHGATITTGAVTVDTTADLIKAANTSRVSISIFNAGAATVYLGGSGVTTSNGIPVAAGDSFTDRSSSAAWYGIVASGSVDIRYVEVT